MSRQDNRPASLARNTVARSAGTLSGYVLSFVSAPIILDGLGLRKFGIWALTGALAQYGALLDLGVGLSIARYIAAHADDRRICGQYMAVGWITVGVIALALGIAAGFGAAPLSHALGGISVPAMRIVLYSSVVLLCSSMAAGVIGSYPSGLRRMWAPNVGNVLGSVINFVASVGAIALGAGLSGYALANAGAGVLTVFVVAWIVIRAEGPLPFARPEARPARAFLRFAINTQMVRITNLVNYQTDKIVVAFSIGPAAAGAYELANRAASTVRQTGIYVSSAVDIELTAVMKGFGIAAVRARYKRLNEVTSALAFPPVLLIMATAPLLMAAWLHHAPPRSVPIVVALSAAYLIGVSTGVGYGVAVAAGQPDVVAKVSIGTALANVAFTVALAPLFGIWGILAGTVVALTGGSIAQVILVNRRFDLPAGSYFGAVGSALGTYTALAAPLALISYAHIVHGRGAEAASFVLLSLVYMGVCGAWALKTGRLPSALTSRLPRLGWLTPGAQGSEASDVQRRRHPVDEPA